MKPLIASLVLGVVALAQTPAPPKKSVATKGAAPAAASSRLLDPSLWRARAPELFRAKFTTTKGDFVIEVHRDWAPQGADRFYNLVRSHFFNNATFYRVVKGFIVQFGAAADPKVTAAWNKANIKDDPVKQSNKEGTVTYAMGGPNTRTTEVFINFRDNAQSLDGQGFAPFGTVTEGMDVVKLLYADYGDIADLGGHGPSQARVQAEGKAYLDKNFPKLDSIRTAVIVPAEAPPPPAKK